MIYTVDISNPSQPAVVGTFGIRKYPEGIAIAGQYAYVGTRAINGANPSSLQVLNVSSPGSPALVSQISGVGRPGGVALAGPRAYLTSGQNGLIALDVSDPSSPSVLWIVDPPGESWRVAVSGNYAYVTQRPTGLLVIDISIPNPVVVGSLPANLVIDVAVAGHYAYVAAGDLLVVDVSNPGSPVLVGTASIPGTPGTVAVAGNYAYVGDVGAGLTVVDVSNPASPVITGSLDPGVTVDIAVEGGYAYVAASDEGVKVIDVSNPSLPFLVGTVDTPLAAQTIAIAGNYAYVGDEFALQVVDVSDPTSMFIQGSASMFIHGTAVTQITPALAVAGEHVYMGCQFGFDGLRIFPAQCPATLAIEDPASAVSPSAFLAQNHPNPFARTTSISFAMPPAVDEGSLEVYDALGRQVRVLAKGEMAVGRHAVTWDGRDNRGARVPSGVYFYRLAAGTYQEEKKMVVLRAP